MKPVTKWIFVLSIILAVSLISGAIYYSANKKYMWNIAGVYNLKEYAIDVKKTIPIDKTKPITVVFGQKGKIETETVIPSNYITVCVSGKALSTEKDALPYVFLKELDGFVYLYIHSGISASKMLKDGYYQEDYQVKIYAPEGCLPVRETNFNQDYWWQGIQEKLSNSMERVPTDQEITDLFGRFIDFIKMQDMTGILSLMAPYPGMDLPDSKGEMEVYNMMYHDMKDMFFRETNEYRIKNIKKVIFQETDQYILTAEFLFQGKWRPADFWFRVVDGKLGMDNFDINW
jgi:hypothetical protein